MELRDIEIFLTLAEELHFGRTAERLHVSQARVSQSIKRQERRIGATLFERTSRTVLLTPVGRRLREDLQRGYELIQAGIAAATAAGRGLSGTVRLGLMGALGPQMRGVIEAFRARHPDCDVRTLEFHFGDPFGALRGGRVDLQLLWLPVREPDLTVGPVVLTEGRLLAVPAGHPLAGRASACLDDLADQVVFGPGRGLPPYWEEAMVPLRTPGGRPVPRGPAVRTFPEALALVAAGQGVTVLNEHVARHHRHPGVVCLPIHDAPPTEWALVWRTTGESAHVRAFAQTVRQVGVGVTALPGSQLP
ncbi:LysR family transcriptional regulator [Planotetraspora thailandica]|uniref:LysR family transcriptional regulator n=1 Tax=Planotetraspora thailandica TaxID=487172 RepID=A0A8J4DD79_9ACTN|nr:LysR family transcriptional regulator [Planotetraspora thailandica]GII58261.1 LysR family transcriptional regulator [Planotetraspora thailandica]